jgi:hypothetical protein
MNSLRSFYAASIDPLDLVANMPIIVLLSKLGRALFEERLACDPNSYFSSADHGRVSLPPEPRTLNPPPYLCSYDIL